MANGGGIQGGSLLTRKYRENQKKQNRSKLTNIKEGSQEGKPTRYEHCEESEATMAAERDDIMRMMLAGGHTSAGEGDSNGGHQLNQRDVSFGHDDESGTGRDSIEVCSANNI